MRGGESPPFFYRTAETGAQSSISPTLNALSDLVSWEVFTLRPKSSREEREEASRSTAQGLSSSAPYKAISMWKYYNITSGKG